MFNFTQLKRILVGEPLSNQMASHEKLSKKKALAVLSSDALSSVAYATEEILIPLAAFSSAAVIWSLPIALAIGILLLILTLSYRQTIDSYPAGGGAYTVAKENLGIYAGLIAAASLLIDYVLTVAVSVAAGVENLASAFPFLHEHRVWIGSSIIIVIMILNLRGIQESANIFMAPTYFFLFSFFSLIVVGIIKSIGKDFIIHPPINLNETYAAIPLFLILRAFSSGCSALTGIEAISNGIPVFKAPSQENAKKTLLIMAFILGSLFLGITYLCHVYGIVPRTGETAISSLARTIFGNGTFYILVQASTASILVLAANTSYADFPRLSSLLAKDRFLPRQLASLGDRLVFSNGIIGLSAVAILLLILFQGATHYLIPLYAVGVFLSFTLSQSGMVLHHYRRREKGWLKSLFISLLGACTTAVVLLVIASTKFLLGAWMVLLFIPILLFVFLRIHRHYLGVGKQLSLQGEIPPEKLERFKHIVIVPISGVHRGILEALRYALSISADVRACYVEINPETTARMKTEWNKWAHEVPIVVLNSPYRSVIRPLLEYIDSIEVNSEKEMVTIVVPEFVTSKWRYQILHNQTAFRIRTALLFKKNKVVTSIRYHLKNT